MITFALIIIVCIALYYYLKNKSTPPNNRAYTIDDEYNSRKVEIQKEIDHLLDKMGKNGLDDLSEKDKKRLQELSKKLK